MVYLINSWQTNSSWNTWSR